MQKDRQENALPGASAEAAELLDEAVSAFSLYRGDPMTLTDLAIAAAPDFTLAMVFKGYLLALATEPAAAAGARDVLDQLRAMPRDERTSSHAAALRLLLDGQWTQAADALAQHSLVYTRDFIALHVGHLLDFYRANATSLRDRVGRALVHWSEDVPGYSLLLGMHAFGLEETRDFARAEETGRRAVALQPLDVWAHHAVTHVFEMQGRRIDGIDWMIARYPYWSGDDNFFRGHNWWHRALFHLDAEQIGDVLTLYDGPIRSGRSPTALDLVDASALLWRVHLGGHDVGDRWIEVAQAWDAHADARLYPFNDWHAAMVYLGADRLADVERLLARFRDNTDATDAAAWGRELAVPLIEGFTAFWRGEYDTAIVRLTGLRRITDRLGGSNAQRDVIAWTLTEAALRAGERDLAEQLAQERVQAKPRSRMNLGLLARASNLRSARRAA